MTVVRALRIWKLKGGGYVASAQIPDPKSKPQRGRRPKYKTIFGVLRGAVTAKEALDWLDAERRKLVERVATSGGPIPRWSDYAVSVFEKKVAAGDIASEAGVEKYRTVIANIIRTAPWAALPLDEVRNGLIQDWRDGLPVLTWERMVKSGSVKTISTRNYGPSTLNTWLAIARVIWKAAAVRYELPRNPMEEIKDLSTKTAKTHTKEEPNSLNPRIEIGEFLARLKKNFVQHYAFG
jgi:hypothetical protein